MKAKLSGPVPDTTTPFECDSPDDLRGWERKVTLALLEVKDRDIRISMLEQARSAVDRGIHAGGAFSVTIPLVALYYSGVMQYSVQNPTDPDQDLFILSKGHAVAALASVYADLGYFDKSVLSESRSYRSILNGHPGPLLPGIHVATGPMGQGIGVAGGLAIAGALDHRFDVYTITGDGELQEGTAWEAIMYAGSAGTENLCVIVDHNMGQLDTPRALHLDMRGLASQFAAFGWNVLDVDGTRYAPVVDALHAFKAGPRAGKPTVIISRTTKGWGGFADTLVSHKTTLTDDQIDTEVTLQQRSRQSRVAEVRRLISAASPRRSEILGQLSGAMGLNAEVAEVPSIDRGTRLLPAPLRDPRIVGAAPAPLDATRAYASDDLIALAMRAYAVDPRVVSIDSDLASTSGLQRGVGTVDRRRALNVGVAEANMMLIGEGFAVLGYNAWVSTFCPFFNWNVLRRIAVGFQERTEVIESGTGWLTAGHGVDLTFLATAPNFETRTNGATHMGNDDLMVFRAVPHLRIIDTGCPELLLSVVEWIMCGGRGLVYLRVPRAPSTVIHHTRPAFEFGKSYVVQGDSAHDVTIVSSGRGVHEAIAAAQKLELDSVRARVIDMPTVDPDRMLELHDARRPVVFAEQNNGYLVAEYHQVCAGTRSSTDSSHVRAINALTRSGASRFIHSGTYEELLAAFGLDSTGIASACQALLAGESAPGVNAGVLRPTGDARRV